MNLLSLNFEELTSYVTAIGEKKFRAKQLYDAMITGKKPEDISNLPKDFINKIKEDYPQVEILKILKGSDGTKKYLFKMKDGEIVEGVFLPYSYGNTFCVSCQVGCRMGCEFCASGINGLVRNLEAGEMLSMIVLANIDNGGDKSKRAITNIVMMGSGEPLDNYEEVVKFLHLVSYEEGLNISLRNITLSTCGLVDKINALADLNLPITLTISLHAATDEKRKKIMKIANRYTVKEIVEASKIYYNKTKRRVSFEYSLIKGFNDKQEDIDVLIKLFKGLGIHVNLIPLNNVKEKSLIGTARKSAYAFMEKLNREGISATVRRTMGEDIEGACGQLRAKNIVK